MVIELYFSQHFGVSPTVLEDYGAFEISLASDLPLFIDPFLLFNSQKPEYRDLHEGMIRYLVFLRDRATPRPRSGAHQVLVHVPGGEAELARIHGARQLG